ncbi:neurite extension and migration factor [Alosa sapidissima]|uniref:neurite extension and migration factor n=1 Tax=Alosa sapidissima TaxID=34773 RepID=UPI001C082E2F|nr:neurite extension and migration factor [Alosa sapidissima]
MDLLQKSKSSLQQRAPESTTEQLHNLKVCTSAVCPPSTTLHPVRAQVPSSVVLSPSPSPGLPDFPDETAAPPASLSSLSSLSSFALLSPLSSSSSSLSSLSSISCATSVAPWPAQSSADKTPLSTMELGSAGGGSGVDGGGGSSEGRGDCLSSHTKSPAESESCESVLGLPQEFQPCSASTIPCLGSDSDEQVLSDQLLSDSAAHGAAAAVVPSVEEEEEAAERALRGAGSESDGDPTAVEATQSIYEGLGEEETQDWSCLESLISESRMELLDLCSRSELAVNLFCEEDVDNYMFQEEDTALAGDVCSLKIRYESFSESVHERSSDADADALQEAQQHLGFFPACPRRETSAEKPESWDTDKADALTPTPIISPTSQSLFDFSSSPGESAEFSDDSSSCTGSSPDTWLARREHGNLSRENSSSSSSQLSYRLRAKRKVAFREDYLYDVDSIESERNAESRTEKKPKPKVGLKKEKDDDWCPKKRRKSHRKDPPVIIKYIIINRFKGVKHMTVKLGRVDASTTPVSLSADSLNQYEKLAPLKAFWQSQSEKEQLALGNKVKHLNGCKLSPGAGLKKRRHRMANRLRIQRIHTTEKTPVDSRQEVMSSQMNAAEAEKLRDKMSRVREDGVSGGVTSACLGGPGPRRRKMRQESEERGEDNKPIRVRKFRSEARLRAKKLADAQASMSAESEPAQAYESSTRNPQDTKVSTSSNAPDKCTLTLNSSGGAAPANMPPLPGGYLQTLLEASESSNNACTSYFPLSQEQQQQSQPFVLGVPFQPPQSCVLSPPSESELPQSPHGHGSYPGEKQQGQGYASEGAHHADTSYPAAWPSQPGETHQLPFPSAIPAQSPMMHSGFPKQALLTPDGKATAVGYLPASSVGDSRVVSSEEMLQPEQQQQLLDLEYRLSPNGAQGDGGGVGRLVSFDSLGSLSVASSNYSSLSLHEGEGGDGDEGEMSDNFLSHCSPQLVLQQSLEEMTPLRESTDLLDISNFTPDKFRHASLSEMSPPVTPSPSPHLIRQGAGFPTEAVASELHWDCGVVSSSELEDVNGSRHTHLLQIHSFGPNEEDEEESNSLGKDEEGGFKGKKGLKRKGAKSGPKKTKSPKAAKGEQSKSPRQESKSARKIKAILEGKANKGMGGSHSGTDSPSAAMLGVAGEWPGGGLSDDDQQEFKEPSNILSNIVSGMAEVQRFMRASVEPLWGPCPPPGEQSLQSQTLRILGGPFESGKKRGGGGGTSGAGRGKKGAGRGAKNPPKLIPADFFPALGLDCFPVPHRPAHKKMYRHKSSAKFSREELALSKGNAKVSALTATLEKQR